MKTFADLVRLLARVYASPAESKQVNSALKMVTTRLLCKPASKSLFSGLSAFEKFCKVGFVGIPAGSPKICEDSFTEFIKKMKIGIKNSSGWVGGWVDGWSIILMKI